MLAIGYARTATENQADEGVSLAAQTERIRAMAAAHNATLLDVIIDRCESGMSTNRPGLQRVLELTLDGTVQAIFVTDAHRLTRSVTDLCAFMELFEKRKVTLISGGEPLDPRSAAGQLLINLRRSAR